MGRMNPPPIEATRGSSAAAVAEQWRQHDKEREARSARKFEAIDDWLRLHPDLCVRGVPCPFAAAAAALVRSARPELEGKDFKAEVQRLRLHRLRRAFTEEEVARILDVGLWPGQPSDEEEA